MSSSWKIDFTKQSLLSAIRFPIKWGSGNEFVFQRAGLTLTSDGTAAGFMTSDLGGSKSDGYGLYQATFTMPDKQASGPYICLWPSTNKWPGPEIDFVEQRHDKPYMTVHWMGASNSNRSQSILFDADLSRSTTIALDWQAAGLTFYVDDRAIVHYQSGGSVPVPKDYADGGENEAFGVGNVGPEGTSLTVSNMSYTPAGLITPIPNKTIVISAPGVLQEASLGSGATTSITISDPGLSNIYAIVMDSHNVGESNWTSVLLDSSGQAAHNFHFENSGDYLLVVDNKMAPIEQGVSSAVTIVDPIIVPSTIISVSGPGMQFVADPAFGADVSIKVSDPGLKQVYAFVMNSHNVAEQNWAQIPLSSGGTASHTFHFQHTGDYVLVVSDPITQVDRGVSGHISIFQG